MQLDSFARAVYAFHNRKRNRDWKALKRRGTLYKWIEVVQTPTNMAGCIACAGHAPRGSKDRCGCPMRL